MNINWTLINEQALTQLFPEHNIARAIWLRICITKNTTHSKKLIIYILHIIFQNI